jgi:lipopolysaccharide export system ATP-binding protein
MSKEFIYVIKGLRKVYTTKEVFKDIWLSFYPGAKIGVIGPNGAGKSTILKIMAGIDKDFDGEAWAAEGTKIGYLPQEASIFRRLTVKENILVALEAQGVAGNAKLEKLESLLNDFNVKHIRDSYGYALSGGERRRVEIARALAGEPKFILLDEPFAGIDPIAVGDIQEIIRQLKTRGIGVLITDHNVRETLGICDYAYIMKDGRVQVEGAANEIANSELAKKFYLGENFRL